MPTLVLQPHIRSARIGEDVFLLDLASGRYAAFQPPQSYWWDAALGGPAPDPPPPGGMVAFAAAMVAKGFLMPGPAPDVPRPNGVARAGKISTWRALYYLFTTDRAIGRGKFPALYDRLLRTRPAVARRSRSVADIERVFLRAEAILFFRKQKADCLPRSMALARLCRRGGVAAEHVIGIRRAPFEAHAWVRIGDRCVLDSLEFVRGFTPIAIA